VSSFITRGDTSRSRSATRGMRRPRRTFATVRWAAGSGCHSVEGLRRPGCSSASALRRIIQSASSSTVSGSRPVSSRKVRRRSRASAPPYRLPASSSDDPAACLLHGPLPSARPLRARSRSLLAFLADVLQPLPSGVPTHRVPGPFDGQLDHRARPCNCRQNLAGGPARRGPDGRYRDAEPTRPSMDDHPTGGHFQHRGIPTLTVSSPTCWSSRPPRLPFLAVDHEVHPSDSCRASGVVASNAACRADVSSSSRLALVPGVVIRTKEEP
jgi:hypothetical protein